MIDPNRAIDWQGLGLERAGLAPAADVAARADDLAAGRLDWFADPALEAGDPIDSGRNLSLPGSVDELAGMILDRLGG